MKSLFFLIALFALKPVFATTYYFSNISGQDSYTSTQAQNPATPWKTITKLNSYTNLQPGDSVLFKKGETFYGTIAVSANGALNKEITYSSYGTGANPVISGFTTLTNWTLLSGNIYYATVSKTMVQGVTLDGIVKGLGRYPNTGYLTYTAHTSNSITATSASTFSTTYVGGEVVIKKQRYILDRHKITAQSGNTITYNSTNFYGNNSVYLPVDGNGFFIQGHLSTLDQEGEWYFDSNTQRLYMHFGTGTPNGRTVKVSTVNSLASLNVLSYITFNNLDFEGGNTGVENNSSNNIKIINCNFRQQAVGIYGNYSTNIQVSGGSISDCATNGIFMDDNDTNISVNGTTVTRCGTIPGLGMSGDAMYNGILIVGNGTTITNCTIKNIGYNGIYFDGNNVLVEHNLVDSFCTVKDDGGGIYTFTNDGLTRSNRIIRNNIVQNSIGNFQGALFDGDAFGKAPAIYLDGYSNHTEVSGNTCSHGSWGGIYVNGNSNNQILNNTTYDFNKGLLIYVTATTGSGSVRNLTIAGNKFIAKTATQETMHVDLFVNDNPSLFGTFDNNYYARPIDDNATITVFNWQNGTGFGPRNMNLATWKSTYNLDANSQKSPIAIPSVDDINIRCENNPTNVSKTFVASVNYVDVKNVQYSNNISLQPYTSVVLLKSQSTSKADQTITFPSIASKAFGVAPFTLNATASSGLPVSFNVVSGPAVVTGNTVTVNGTGTATITASQAGNANYNAATATQSFTITKADQTINFAAVASKTYGVAPFDLAATSSSSLPVSFRVVSGPATISGTTITLTGAGTVAIEASQAGNANYNTATIVTQSVAVIAVKDITAPTIITKDITVQTDANGQAVIKPADVIQSITDISGIDNSSIQISQTQFTCSNVSSVASSTAATHQAYVSSTTTGVQTFGGELGMVFKVNNAAGITINQLGAFDHQGNGITGTQNGGIRVAIFNKATKTIVPGLDAIIVGMSDGYNGLHRMKNVTPVTLMQGEYVVVAKGYNQSELNGNGAMGSPIAFGDIAGGAISYGTNALYGQEGSGFNFPANQDAITGYLAGTFSYSITPTATATSGAHQAYTATTTAGVQNFGGELGMEFKVNSAAGIIINELGAFDHQGNGITGTQNGGVRVAIFNKATKTVVPGLDAIIIGMADGYNGLHRLKTITPVTLMQGEYVVVAKGYNSNEMNGNAGMGSSIAYGDIANGAISYGTKGLYGSEGSGFNYPVNQDGAAGYLAGTFTYSTISNSTTNSVNTVTITAKDIYGNVGQATAKVTVVCNQGQTQPSQLRVVNTLPVAATTQLLPKDSSTGIKATVLNVFPVPTTGRFTLQLSNLKTAQVAIEIVSENGMIVSKKSVSALGMNTLKMDMDLTSQNSGVYFIKVLGANGVKTGKVVVQH